MILLVPGRSEVTAAPVKCLPVDNILTDVVEKTMDPDTLQERIRRRQKWDRVAARAADAWKEFFARRNGLGHRARTRPPGERTGPVDTYQQTNFNLGTMLGVCQLRT